MSGRIANLFRNLLRKSRVEQALDDELQSSTEILTQEKMQDGLSPSEASRQALVDLGGVEQVKEEVRTMRLGHFLENFARDLRFAVRTLARSPVLTAIVVLTLALGIGANTAIFGIVNGILLRPLPVRAPEQIMVLAAEQKGASLQGYYFSYLDLADYRKQTDAFSDLFAYSPDLVGLSANGRADQIMINYVTGNYFTALGLQPTLGRLFLPNEGERKGEAPIFVLGYSYWQKRFGGAPSVVGKQILVDGKPARIVGVGPKDFSGAYPLVEVDGYLPINRVAGFEQPAGGPAMDRAARMWRVLGRLKPRVGLAQAQTSVNVIAARLAEQYPEADKGIAVRVVPERRSRPDPQVSNAVPIITSSFLALAGIVLLVACMNVANVLLVRATVRQREMGIRVALGGSRGRLVLQMLTESLLLALLGGAAGTILGWSANGLISSTLQSAISAPLHLEFGLDWRVFTYAFGAAVFAAVIAGGWPALRASKANVNTALREGGRGDSVGPRRHRVRNVLVVTQLAGALVSLIAAGLFVRSLGRLQKMDLGFDPDHVLNVILDPRGIGYDEAQTKRFYRELETRAWTLPGVRSAALAFSVPMGNYNDARPVYIEGRPLAPGQQPPLVLLNRVDPPYFETMRTPLLRGRGFTESDSEGAPKVAIVNQTMARRFWPNEEPIGKRFSIFGDTGPWMEVVGVAKDGKYYLLALTESTPYFYLPLAQDFTSMRALQIRSSVPPESLITPVQQEIRALAPDLPVIDVRTMKQGLGGTNGFFMFRIGATLAAVMGLIGMTLALVGVYGVISYTAARRTHEIGIRMALGAEPHDVLRLILRQGMSLVAAGLLPGLIAAWAVTHAMSRLFVGVTATDPLTYASVTLLLAAIALWACYVPARRAMRLDPAVALRYE